MRPAAKRKRSTTEQVVPGTLPTGRTTSHNGLLSTPHLPSNPFNDPNYPIRDFERVYNLMRDPSNGLNVTDRRWRLLNYAKSFVGSEAVTWIVENLSIDRPAALAVGQRLMDAGIIHHVTHSESFSDEYYFYRFQEDDDTNILNMKRIWDSSIPTRPAVEVAKDLLTQLALLCEEHRKHVLTPELTTSPPIATSASITPTPNPIIPPSPIPSSSIPQSPLPGHSSSSLPAQINSPHLMRTISSPPLMQHPPRLSSASSAPSTPLYHRVGSTDGDDVDYSKLAKSERFRKYTLAAAELQRVQLTALNHDERLCFFVNLYNVVCLHAHVTQGPPNSVLRRYTFFRALSYRVAGLDMTLDDIEHGILRGNKRPPMLRFMQQLRPSDPKCQHVLSKRDGRIHFVISAGTRSDPPIRILDGDNVQEELHDATVEFLSMTVKVDVEKRSVTLPRTMMWYTEDFPSPEKTLLLWVARYLPTATANALVTLVNSSSSDPSSSSSTTSASISGTLPSISYENFDWANAEARFNASVVRRKRRRLEQERSRSMSMIARSLAALDVPLFAPITNGVNALIGHTTGRAPGGGGEGTMSEAGEMGNMTGEARPRERQEEQGESGTRSEPKSPAGSLLGSASQVNGTEADRDVNGAAGCEDDRSSTHQNGRREEDTTAQS